VVISVADDMEDGMFEIGSAVPRRDLVLAMEKIGKTLIEHEGSVTINGHTDGRPFSRGDYDNWRLSTARAPATYYMLVRGGLDEQRITGVAGFADRKLKRPDDPYASVNRRIEILLGTAG
jgi:chemotaxis protein MotB